MTSAGQRTVRRVRYGRLHAHAVDLSTAVELIVQRVHSGIGGFAVTPNVDHLSLSRQNPEFVAAYRRSFLALADGMPLVLVSRILGLPIRERVAGSDLFEPLLRRCAEEGFRVFFLGSTDDTVKRAMEQLEERWPGIDIVGWDSSPFDPEGRPEDAVVALRRAKAADAEIIVSCLPGPKQEIILSRYAYEYHPAVAVGTGASLSFYVGDVERAPTWVSRSGFEWLYRLMREPGRLWRRYLVRDIGALPVFARMALARLFGQSLVEVDPELSGSPSHGLPDVPSVDDLILSSGLRHERIPA